MKIFKFIKGLTVAALSAALLIMIGLLMFSKGFSHFDRREQANMISAYDSYGSAFYSDSESNKEHIDQMKDVLSVLPQNAYLIFQSDWKVVVAEQIPSQLKTYTPGTAAKLSLVDGKNSWSVIGFCNWPTRTIFIRSQLNPADTNSIFLHELGHFFDCEFGLISSTESFNEIYSLYKNSFTEADDITPAGYAALSAEEFFATVFKEYFLSPEHLRESAPKAYDFMESLFQEVAAKDSRMSALVFDVKAGLASAGSILKNLVGKFQN